MSTVFLAAVEVAAILKVSRAQAYRLFASGEIPSLRFGRTVRVREEDLERFLTCHTEGEAAAGEPIRPECTKRLAS